MKLSYKNISPKDVVIELPSSKSISNRALIIQALTNEKIELANLSMANDTQLMIKNLKNDNVVKDVGMAGSTARFLTAFYACQNQTTTIQADKRMQERPMKILCDALLELGTEITFLNKEGHLPFRVCGKNTKGKAISIDASVSSQFITALMLIGPVLKNGLTINLSGIISSKPYIAMTKNIMSHFGVEVDSSYSLIKIEEQEYKSNTLEIENDWSAAAFFYSALALLDEGSLILKNLSKNSWQGDNEISDIFYRLGVKTNIKGRDVLLEKSENMVDYLEYDFTSCPDLAQAVICTCSGLGIHGKFTGLHTLKIKETNRVIALQNELKKLRWDFYESKDGSYILERSESNTVFNNNIKTYNDHRMAMAFAPLTIVHDLLQIENPDVVQKSFPNYWVELAKIGVQ